MRHRCDHRKLGRTSEHRQALMRNLVCSLIEHGRIVTTLPKAKEARRFAERCITIGKKAVAATDPALTGGEYVGPGGFRQARGRPKLVGMTKAARDADLAAAVWEASQTATGVSFDLA